MRKEREVELFTDGAIGMGGIGTGLGMVVRRPDGTLLACAGRHTDPVTNNEAEYLALIAGLEMARRYRPRRLQVWTDSEIVVRQMQGASAVRSAKLKPLYRRACEAARRFRAVTYTHLPRKQNRLADALAVEALGGRSTELVR